MEISGGCGGEGVVWKVHRHLQELQLWGQKLSLLRGRVGSRPDSHLNLKSHLKEPEKKIEKDRKTDNQTGRERTNNQTRKEKHDILGKEVMQRTAQGGHSHIESQCLRKAWSEKPS